jgi:hypothetical protein
MWPWKVAKWPWVWAEVAVKAWRDLTTLDRTITLMLVQSYIAVDKYVFRSVVAEILHCAELYLIAPVVKELNGV